MGTKLKWHIVVEIDEEALAHPAVDLVNNEDGHCEIIESVFNPILPHPLRKLVSAKVTARPALETIARVKGYKNVFDYQRTITE